MEENEVYFVTFAGGSLRWYLAGFRLLFESRKFQSISYRRIHTPLNLKSRKVLKDSGFSFSQARRQKGYGFWRWKPMLLNHTLLTIPENSILIYLDAGCQLNYNEISSDRFSSYIRKAKQHGIVAMEIEHSINSWTKRVVIDFFSGVSNLRKGRITQSGILFLRNTAQTRTLVNNWSNLSIQKPHFFNDFTSSEHLDFISHRHDQSVLSCLMIQFQLQGIPDETYFAPDWKINGYRFPIWATRTKGILKKW